MLTDIDLGQGVLIALFMAATVFATLSLVYLLIQLVAFVLRKLSSEESKTTAVETVEDTSENISPSSSAQDLELLSEDAAYGGTMKLRDVDEPTAAMIMAIISDNSGIPLSELCFKSIRLITEE